MKTTILSLLLLFATLLPAQETIPLSAIKPGMTGYGLSVFRGDKIERFDVEVIDILRGALPKQDLILIVCKSSYDGFDLSSSGLIAGMSGSPIYFQGKLAGALSYGWNFAKETVAGVTPIENMLRETKRPIEREKMAYNAPRAIGSLVPLRSPLVVSGVTPRSFAKLETWLQGYGFVPIQGGSGGTLLNKSDQKLVPGGAMGAQLLTGDMDITAIGTVTWVDGDNILGFGHPFFNVGEFFVPITNAHIAMVMKSSAISFKMGFPTAQVGSLVQDRLSGIYGKLGEVAPMLPLSVKISNKVTGNSETFQVRVARHSYITPQLCSLAVYNFLDSQEASWGNNTTWIHSKIFLQGRKAPLEEHSINASKNFYAGQILATLPYLYQSPYRIPEIERIEVEISLAHKLQSASIVGMRLEKSVVEPGEKVEGEIFIHPHQSSRCPVPFSFTVPSSLEPGQYTLTVTGGGLTERDMALPEDADGYLQALDSLDHYQNNEIVAVLSLPRFKVAYRGYEMPQLPPTVFGSLFSPNNAGDVQMLSDNVVTRQTTPYVITGNSRFLLQVKKAK